MNWRNTWILVGLAVALFAFIVLVERRLPVAGEAPPPVNLFAEFKPSAATTVQLRRGTQPAVRLVKTNSNWHFTAPFSYPAADFAVQDFLETLERIVPSTHISPRELRARKQTAADFGFDAPPVTIVLEQGDQRAELHLGARTPAGDQVYAELIGQPGYYVIAASVIDSKMPRTQHEWRDTALFQFGDARLDRAEIYHDEVGFALSFDSTNRIWRLARPSVRADQLQVDQFLHKVRNARVLEFVADGPQVNAEPYGLQTPQAEIALGSGNSVQRVQFGNALTNDPSRVYARLTQHSNIVLVSKTLLDLAAMPYAALRDQQLAPFAPELVDAVEVLAEETFTLRKGANGVWTVGGAPVDPVFVSQWLALLSQLQTTEFVKDVVTDFSEFGLKSPQRRYVLHTAITNAAGATNIPIAQLDFATNGSVDRVFARRADEDSVYAVSPIDYARMPSAAWQLRDHQIWNFTTNQVAKITLTQPSGAREALRQPSGDWIAVRGFENAFNPFAMEEIALKLGELNAMAWLGRGADVRERFGFGNETAQLAVELRGGDKPQTLTIEFGGISPLRLPYALTTLDGQPAVFEFPWTLYYDLQRYLGISVPTRNAR